MKNDKNKSKEPFRPENTPMQPDHAPNNKLNDPSPKNERNEKKAPVEEPKKPDQKQEAKPKLLGESETEITDETTI